MNPTMSPDLLKQLMPFLAGMGFPTLMQNLEKMKKVFGAEEGQKPGQQQPGAAQAGPPGAGTPTPQGAAPPQLAALAALMKARMGGAA